MSTTTPTTSELSTIIIAQLETSLNQSLPLLPKSFSRVLAKALAGVFILLYKYVGFGILQLFVRTASAKDTEVNGKTINPLTLWGELVGAGAPVAATQAELLIDVTVTNQTGSLPEFTQLVGATNGVTYLTTASVFLDAPVVQVVVRASADQSGGNGAGAIGNLEAGAAVSFVNPLANVDRNATVVSQVVTGADAESTEAYRQRVIDRFQKRPQGGALADYELWGEEPAGIVNVYPYRSDCPGMVDVYVEATPESSGNPDGIPTAAQLQEVLDSINFNENGLANRRPVSDLVQALPITRTAFDVAITNLIVDNIAEVQATIASSLSAYYQNREPWIEGLTVPPRADRVSESSAAGIVDDIVSAAGGTFDNLVQSVGGIAVPAYSLGLGEKAKLGAVTYV